MDGPDLSGLTEPILPAGPPGNVDAVLLRMQSLKGQAGQTISLSEDEKKKQVARDFESVLIGKLLDQVESSIGSLGFEEDPDLVGGQIKGIFWMYLAREIGDKGGFGLWKDVYQFLSDTGGAGAAQTLDRDI